MTGSNPMPTPTRSRPASTLPHPCGFVRQSTGDILGDIGPSSSSSEEPSLVTRTRRFFSRMDPDQIGALSALDLRDYTATVQQDV